MSMMSSWGLRSPLDDPDEWVGRVGRGDGCGSEKGDITQALILVASALACSFLGLKRCTDRYTPQPYPHLPDVRARLSKNIRHTSPFLRLRREKQAKVRGPWRDKKPVFPAAKKRAGAVCRVGAGAAATRFMTCCMPG